jgi:hypothetical protein
MRSQIRRWQESLVLYKSSNTLWGDNYFPRKEDPSIFDHTENLTFFTFQGTEKFSYQLRQFSAEEKTD